MTSLTDPIFNDEDAARAHFERQRWPDGKPVCPHCGAVDQATRLEGKSHRPGLFVCRACRDHFTVMVGTVMEASHIPLHKWTLGFHLMASSKKGVSAHQLMRNLGLGSYRTAWFMAHRIREAMTDRAPEPLGGNGATVEIDETYLGKTEDAPKKLRQGRSNYRNTVLTLVERGGAARSFKIEGATTATIKPILEANLARETAIMTDQGSWYPEAVKDVAASHDTVSHNKDEYARYEGERVISTNTVEGYFSIFKRGMVGVYQHCNERHLHRYLAEFDFRYSNRSALGVDDTERAARAIKGAEGKRLTYQKPRSARAGEATA
jgi:transposase-like protein